MLLLELKSRVVMLVSEAISVEKLCQMPMKLGNTALPDIETSNALQYFANLYMPNMMMKEVKGVGWWIFSKKQGSAGNLPSTRDDFFSLESPLPVHDLVQ